MIVFKKLFILKCHILLNIDVSNDIINKALAKTFFTDIILSRNEIFIHLDMNDYYIKNV